MHIGVKILVILAVATELRQAVAQGAPLKVGDIFVGNADFHRLSGHPSAIIRVDPLTGDRLVVADDTHGLGDRFQAVTDLVFDYEGNLLAVDAYGGQLFRVNPLTGDRQIVTGNDYNSGVGNGPLISTWGGRPFVGPDGLIFLVDNDNLDLTVTHNAKLFQVDPVTGDRAIISDRFHGSGPTFFSPSGVIMDALGNFFVTDQDKIFKVNGQTGDRTILSDAEHGTGAEFRWPRGIAFDLTGNLIIPQAGEVLRINPITGDRALLSGFHHAGPPLGDVASVAIDADGSVLVVDSYFNALFRIDPNTGERQNLSSAIRGSGQRFEFPVGVAVYIPEPGTIWLAVFPVALFLSYLMRIAHGTCAAYQKRRAPH